MKQLAFWRIAYLLATAAALVMGPLALVAMWLCKAAHTAQERAEIGALHASAMERTRRERRERAAGARGGVGP